MSDEPARPGRPELAREASEKLHAAEVEYQAAVLSGMPELFIAAAAHVKRARQELDQVTRAVAPPPAGLGHEAAPPGAPVVGAAPRAERVTLVTLTGSREECDWLEAVQLRTGLSRTAIVRSALGLWAATNGHPPPPTSGDD